MSSTQSSTPSTTRSSELARNLPVGTAATIGLCASLHVSQLVLDWNIRLFTMCPRLVLYLHEYYRIVSSCFFHGSIMHIGMNMISTAAIATWVEKRFGTLYYIMIILWSVLITGLFYLLIAVLAQKVWNSDDLLYSHSLGFSGIMFHLLVIESNGTPHASRSVLGFVSVPSYAYPVVMLVVMSVLLPNVSFVGHLCGILAGFFHIYGLLDLLLLKDSFLQDMEQWRCLRFVTSKENFVPTPTSGQAEFRRDPGTFVKHVERACQFAWTIIRRVLESFQVSVFGRGRQTNSNIYWGRSPWDESNNGNGNSTTSDEEAQLAEQGEHSSSKKALASSRDRIPQQSHII